MKNGCERLYLLTVFWHLNLVQMALVRYALGMVKVHAFHALPL
jgi:hypothetical protein